MSGYRCYIDWSGSPVYYAQGGYALTALFLEKKRLDDLLYNLKIFVRRESRDLNLRKFSTPFTATDLIRGHGDFSAIHIDDRVYLLEELVQFVIDNGLKILSVYFDKSNIYYSNNRRYDVNDWIENWSWTLLLERLERFSDQVTRQLTIILQDINPEANKLYADLMDNISISDNYVTGKYLNNVEFKSKSDSIFLQITDILAWVIRRFYDDRLDYNRFDEMATLLFEDLGPCFVADENGDVEGYGMKLFPPPGPVDDNYDRDLTERQKLALLETSFQVQKKLDENRRNG